MAKVVIQPTGDRYVNGTYNWVTITTIGIGLGIMTWVLALLLGIFVIDPLLCRSTTVQACSQSSVVAGNIAAIVSAIIGAIVLIRLHVRHSLWIVFTVILSFWGLSTLTHSLGWGEALAWTALLYGVGYLYFTWVMRLRSTTIAVVLAVATALIFRWIAFL